MLLYDLLICFAKNAEKLIKWVILTKYPILWLEMQKITCLCIFWAFFAKQFNKTHRITSDFYHMRKFLTKKFRSQGTPLGPLGSLSWQDMHLGACRFQFLVIWGLNKHPMTVACQGQAKNPKTAGAWCEAIILE